MFNNFKIIGLQENYDDLFLTVVVGNMNSIMFGGIRPFAGFLFDKLGFYKCINFILIC